MRRDSWFVQVALQPAKYGAAYTISVIGLSCDRPPRPSALKLRNELIGLPYTRIGPEHVEHYGSREGTRLGPLTGYAVLYRFVAKEGRNGFAEIFAAQAGGLLVVHLTDGCVSFETTILLQSIVGRDPWAPLDSFLTEVTIEKSRGERAGPPPPPGSGYSAIVGPRRKGE